MVWTVLFVVAVMVLGCVLFSVHDWGRPSGNRGRRTRMRDCGGVVHGPYLPPVYLSDRPIPGELRGVPSTARIGGVDMGKYREFHTGHGGGPATVVPPVPK